MARFTGVRERDGRPKLHEIGAEPDPRFTCANERTFLAWNRTSLALIALAHRPGLAALGPPAPSSAR